MPRIPFALVNGGAAKARRTALDTELDREVSEALVAGVLAATPEQRLTLLTLVENPRLLQAVEAIIHETSGGAR